MLIELLTEYGYWGMLIAAFLAGSFFPFSSEAIMCTMIAAGLNPVQLVVYATIGNVAGSVLNYYIGRLGRMEWIETYLHVKKEKVDRAQRIMAGHGAWIGILAFLPVIGTAITIALGLMKANFCITLTSVTIGKLVRYVLLAYGTAMLI